MNDRAAAVAVALDRLPTGTFRARALGGDWIATRSLFAHGASEKLVARRLDAPGYVSLNLYRLETGPRLRPCEMSAAWVAEVVLDLRVTERERASSPPAGAASP